LAKIGSNCRPRIIRKSEEVGKSSYVTAGDAVRRAGSRIARLRDEFEHRHKRKCAFKQMWMRHYELESVDEAAFNPQNIEIDRAGPPTLAADSSELHLDG
jgi:hypothetical protein